MSLTKHSPQSWRLRALQQSSRRDMPTKGPCAAARTLLTSPASTIATHCRSPYCIQRRAMCSESDGSSGRCLGCLVRLLLIAWPSRP